LPCWPADDHELGLNRRNSAPTTKRSDERRDASGQAVCLWTLPPETIKRVYFGYGYNASQIADDILNVTRYGAKPEFYTIPDFDPIRLNRIKV
jgi:hypothetical protein